jgi:hypothetical protein
MRMTLFIVVGIPLVALLYFYVIKDIIDNLRK